MILVPKVNTLNGCKQADLLLLALKGKPLGFHMVNWEYMIHFVILIMIGWTIMIGCIGNQALRKIIHLSTILTLVLGLTLEIPLDLG